MCVSIGPHLLVHTGLQPQHGGWPLSCFGAFPSLFWATLAYFHGFQVVMQMSAYAAIFPRGSSTAEDFKQRDHEDKLYQKMKSNVHGLN